MYIVLIELYSKEDDCFVKYVTKSQINMRETRRNELSVVLLWVCAHFGCAHDSRMTIKLI